MRRSAFTNALFCMLLILAGALFTLSSGLWYSVNRTRQNLDEITTTIAMPDMMAIRRYATSAAEDSFRNRDTSGLSSMEIIDENTTAFHFPDGFTVILENSGNMKYIFQDGTENEFYIGPNEIKWYKSYYIEELVVREIEDSVYDYDLDIFDRDDRRVYGGYVPGINSVAFGFSEDLDYDAFIESLPQSAAAFIVKCTEVIETFQLHGFGIDMVNRSYVGRFEVEENLYVHNGRRPSRTLTAYFPASNPDGSAPVEEGKRYILSGHNYAQGERGPSWYSWQFFPTNLIMPNALYVGPLGSKSDSEIIGYFEAFHELPSDISINIVHNSYWQDTEISDMFPMSIRELIPKVDEKLGHEGLTWFELDGSLEEALNSDRGKQIEDGLSLARVSANSLQVLTTNDVNSIFRFNQRVNKIVNGRTISAIEHEEGARVCIISNLLAEENDLSVGDILPMQLYNVVLGQLRTVSAESAWIPSLYRPNLELTEPLEYEIVGIYSGLRQEMRDHTITSNVVIIPASSFDGLDEETGGFPRTWLETSNAPPLLNALIIPNGQVAEAKERLENITEGFSSFFRFFDQGYARLVPILENLHFGMSWILALSATGWLVSLVMFSLFYTGRRIKDMSLLYGLGVSKAKCFWWVFTQCGVIILAANGIVIAALLPVYENILESALYISSEFTEVYRNFTLSDMSIAGGIRFTLPLDRTVMGMVYAVAGSAFILLITSCIIIARATKNRWKSRQGVD